MISQQRCYAAITESTSRLAGIVAGADEATRIPTCPDWSMRQLATHVGRAQRWAAEIVSRRSAEFVPFRDVPDGRIPDDPEARPGWLTAGASLLVDTVSGSPREQVWTLLGLGPAAFWARRMTHETAVHLADAELAAGRPVSIPPDIGADAVDEWLMLLSQDPDGDGLPLAEPGQTMHLHATDDGLDGAGEWLVTRTASGITVETGHAKADVAVRGPAARLLLVLLRRLPVSTPDVDVLGDQDLLGYWLNHSAF
jgi:uncharacterized protein (TIGR03083 family)